VRATHVDPDGKTVATAEGEYPFDRLLLAAGTGPRRPRFPGAELPEVLSLGTLEDADALAAIAAGGGRAVVVGGRLRGLSLCHLARRMGLAVTLLVPEAAVGMPQLDPRASQLVYRRLSEDGVVVRLWVDVAAVEAAHGRVAAVTTTSGKVIACSWVAMGRDGTPRAELGAAIGAGIGAIPVNERMETGTEGIYAAGDLCRVWDTTRGDHREAPGWMSASLMGRVAGANMAGGEETYRVDHYHHAGVAYDLPLTLIGRLDDPGDAEVSSAPNAEGYRRLVFRDGKIIAATVLGDRRHATVIRRAVELEVNVKGHELQLLRTDVDLNRLLRPSGEYHLY